MIVFIPLRNPLFGGFFKRRKLLIKSINTLQLNKYDNKVVDKNSEGVFLQTVCRTLSYVENKQGFFARLGTIRETHNLTDINY